MNYAEIKYNDIANGPGVRVSIFVSGCTHRCKNCFNSIAWDFQYGKYFDDEIQEKIFMECKYDYVRGLSLLGGEPFEPENQSALLEFTTEFKKRFPDKDIWCYSGYTYEQITGREKARCNSDIAPMLLDNLDVLVDGKFVQDLYSITLQFRGSSNQRLIDLNKTRESGEITLWIDPNK